MSAVTRCQPRIVAAQYSSCRISHLLRLGSLIVLLFAVSSPYALAVQDYFPPPTTINAAVDACFAQYDSNPYDPPCGSCGGPFWWGYDANGVGRAYVGAFRYEGGNYNNLILICRWWLHDGPCPAGQEFSGPAPGSCKNPQPDNESYVIKLSRTDGSTADSTNLDEIEPQTTTRLVAKVYDQNNQLVPSVDVQLVADVTTNSGGHQHPNAPNRPKGLLSNGVTTGTTVTGSTGSNGMAFTFLAPAPAGDHKIIASCTDTGRACTQQGPDKVWVGIKGLVSLYETHLYKLVGSDDTHPNNHYLTPAATGSVVWLAELYRARFPNDPVLYLNDASLERGGLFDIKHDRRTQWWTPPHKTHQRGIDIDVRANEFVHADSIPHRNYFDFEEIAIKVGCSADMHSEFTRNQHYHMTCG